MLKRKHLLALFRKKCFPPPPTGKHVLARHCAKWVVFSLSLMTLPMPYGAVMSNGLLDSSSVFLLYVKPATLKADPLSCLPNNLAFRRLLACLDRTLSADWDCCREKLCTEITEHFASLDPAPRMSESSQDPETYTHESDRNSRTTC